METAWVREEGIGLRLTVYVRGYYADYLSTYIYCELKTQGGVVSFVL